MNIEVKKHGKGHYRADCLDLPGSPRVGFGMSSAMAMAHLMVCMIKDKQIEYIPTDNIVVNGRKWKSPEFYLNGR